MGRPYPRELEALEGTYRWSLSADISALERLVRSLLGHPLLVVGSGGSLSACHLVARLHEERARQPARALTPFEFLRYPVNENAAVLIISASGSNNDVLAVADHALTAEYVLVGGICARKSSPLAARLARCKHGEIFEYQSPAGKDGFLATNTLLATCSMTVRAYGYALPEDLPAFTKVDRRTRRSVGRSVRHSNDALPLEGTLARVLTRHSVVALMTPWSLPACHDLESKWSECGFGTVTAVDPRNLAHGRHHGLGRRAKDVGVLALATAEDVDAVQRVTRLLPSSIPAAIIRTTLSEAAGALDLIVVVLFLAGAVGRRQGLDPGRPRVPAFGRSLYNARIPKAAYDHAPEGEELWLQRKVTGRIWAQASAAERDAWLEALRSWRGRIAKTSFGGVALDYDGTICDSRERWTKPSAVIGEALTRLLQTGNVLGVATGRGGSVLEPLRSLIPVRFWERVIVGLYNGSHVGSLASLSSIALPGDARSEEVGAVLLASPLITAVAKVKHRPQQVIVEAIRPLSTELLRKMVAETLMFSDCSEMQVIASDHSVDVIPPTASKLRVLERMGNVLPNDRCEILRIGDQGQSGGNDEEFLGSPFGLSVDRVSSALGGCWNLARAGERQSTVLLRYLDALALNGDGTLRLSIDALDPGVQEKGSNRSSPTSRPT